MPEAIQPEVLSLIRFSTQEQTAQGKAGVDGQRRVNQISAQFHGIRIRKEYVVIDVSGRHVARDPQFQQIFQELKDPTLSGLLVPEQSRIVRPESFDDWAVLAHFQKNRKLIYTPTAVINPNTPEGRMTLSMGAMMSSEELHNLKSRFARGKMIARLERKNPGGNQSLPRGFRFIRERNEIGKVTGWHWEQDAVEMVRAQKAFELLFAGEPYSIIAEELGGTGFGWKRAMQNPIWIGIRRYPWESGDEYDPEPTAKNPHPKPRRYLLRREIPLDVPTRQELEAGALPIVKPVMSLESWDAAQENIVRREGIVRKTRAKNQDKTRFLGMGIVYCSCGEMMYFRYGNKPHLDRYYCRSQYPHGPGCGAPSIRRNELDPTIERLISERMLNVKFLTRILDAVTMQKAAAPDPVRIAIETARANLEAGRKELLKMVRLHEIKREEFIEQIQLLETELRQNEALLPAAPPAFNTREFLQGVANTFACFGRLPFVQKREILSGAVKSIIADSRSRTLTALTISGGYLGKANASLPLKTQLAIRPVPDLVFHLPEPFEIPDTYVNRRSGNGQHPNQIARRFRGRIQ